MRIPGIRYTAPARNRRPGSDRSVWRRSVSDHAPSAYRPASASATGYPGAPERILASDTGPVSRGSAPRNPARSAAGPREIATRRPSFARNATARPRGSYRPTVSSSGEVADTPATKGTAPPATGTTIPENDALTGKTIRPGSPAKNRSARSASGPETIVREGAHPQSKRITGRGATTRSGSLVLPHRLNLTSRKAAPCAGVGASPSLRPASRGLSRSPSRTGRPPLRLYPGHAGHPRGAPGRRDRRGRSSAPGGALLRPSGNCLHGSGPTRGCRGSTRLRGGSPAPAG